MVIIIISICVCVVPGKVEREQTSPVQRRFYLQTSEGETIRMMHRVSKKSRFFPDSLFGLTLHKCVRTSRRSCPTPFGLFNRTMARKR
ncbi:hypothetical protein C7B11_24800 [Escherichia coli]|nr:hypothetical protein [Escherichia coli]EFO1540238.1 hypothetical protein [Escherichia coli]MPV35024.1 hypothetical protein [Escherichia coli]PSY32129.1 hypothetical protein C7B11_24800 [Escherichia coli]